MQQAEAQEHRKHEAQYAGVGYNFITFVGSCLARLLSDICGLLSGWNNAGMLNSEPAAFATVLRDLVLHWLRQQQFVLRCLFVPLPIPPTQLARNNWVVSDLQPPSQASHGTHIHS